MTRLGRVEQTRGRFAEPPLTPRTAVIWSVLRAELDRRGDAELTVLDVGGGTGGFAVPLARAGHRVTVVDASPDALAALTRRAAEAGVADRIAAVQGDGDALAGLVEPAGVDLVLCHAVLEVVDDPAPVVAALNRLPDELVETLELPAALAAALIAGQPAA
ncbi:methyltransferase domain-containing protein, partial [Micromonospora sp. NPDC005220]|uniref:class I SAM-dependent methyltransferase n=1 Tax=Micromonospora sp. NPDC005220 TaxID=3155589 RepID=UPI0033A9AFD4